MPPPIFGAMAIPLPPVSGPRAVYADLKAFFRTRHKHQWLFAAISLGIPGYFATAFALREVEKDYVAPTVVFPENWRAGRTIAEIRAQQAIDQAAKKSADAALEARRQKRMAEARELEKQLDSLGL